MADDTANTGMGASADQRQSMYPAPQQLRPDENSPNADDNDRNVYITQGTNLPDIVTGSSLDLGSGSTPFHDIFHGDFIYSSDVNRIITAFFCIDQAHRHQWSHHESENFPEGLTQATWQDFKD
ncbi:uncharacterized protein N7515_005233 [Penicillium bovifimosum]|uniref:Uncharacterized protein n=1 Tax=Penicillium bovifimosum TaxID=126998 RepID=A0A9W9GSD1_9EURO|nr:uncharacterized protein N7515_005233 [Penicillium bovifimosum]KAJ5129194.1 hypothetical protein N7515_005233 [Penicillium bovifimosum]